MQVRPDLNDGRKLYKFSVEYTDSEGKKRTQSGRVWTDNPTQFRKALLDRYDVPGTREISFITLLECDPAVPKTTAELAQESRERAASSTSTPISSANATTSTTSTNDKFYHGFCSGEMTRRNIPNFFEKERALFERITTLQPLKEVKT